MTDMIITKDSAYKSCERKCRCNNRGFTLVELIVVLVILAILAAILVPALLGYIDRAKNQQLIVNGNNILKAVQAEASRGYAEAEDPTRFDKWYWSTYPGSDSVTNKYVICNRVVKTADMKLNPSEQAWFGMKASPDGGKSNKHDYWTVHYLVYVQEPNAVYFNGTEWTEIKRSEVKTIKDDTSICKWYWVGPQ